MYNVFAPMGIAPRYKYQSCWREGSTDQHFNKIASLNPPPCPFRCPVLLPPAMSSINSLPEEVLAAIVAAVAKDVAPAAGESDDDTPGEEEGEKKKKMVATGEEAEPLVAACALGTLALVNRRFHRLVLPYLYADLRVNWDKHNGNYGVVEDTSARVIVNGPQVHHLLAHKPALRLLCRRLKFSFAPQQPPSDQSQVEMAADIVSWCADVTSLDISYLSSSGEGAWPRLHEALRGMSRLERLSTFTNQGGFDLAWLMDLVVGLGSLGSLRVGQSNGGNTPPARPVLKVQRRLKQILLRFLHMDRCLLATRQSLRRPC